MTDNPKHWVGKLTIDPCLRYSSFIFLFGVNILSIIALGIGFAFHGQCSIEQNIAIYLIVGGVIFTIYYTSLLIIVSNSTNEKYHIKFCLILVVCSHSMEPF
jgi:hypothetical protein